MSPALRFDPSKGLSGTSDLNSRCLLSSKYWKFISWLSLFRMQECRYEAVFLQVALRLPAAFAGGGFTFHSKPALLIIRRAGFLLLTLKFPLYFLARTCSNKVKTNIKEVSYDFEHRLSVGCLPPGGGLKQRRSP